MPEASTRSAVESDYLECVLDVNAPQAIDVLTKRLMDAVEDGAIDHLPALYAQRAVWHLQLGTNRKAEKDLVAALKFQLTAEDAVEVRLMLVSVYQELNRPDDEARVLQELKASLSEGAHLSALTLRTVLRCLQTSKDDRGSSNGKLLLPNAASAAAPNTAVNGETAAEIAPVHTTLHAANKEPTVATARLATSSGQSNDASVPAAKPSKSKQSKGFASGFFGGASSGAQNGSSALPATAAPAQAADVKVTRSVYGNTVIEEEGEEEQEVKRPAPTVRPRKAAPYKSSPQLEPKNGKHVIDWSKYKKVLLSQLSEVQQTQLAIIMGAHGNFTNGHDHIEAIQINQTISQCVLDINRGEFKQADIKLSDILKSDPSNYQALVARGTCYALRNSTQPTELSRAERDFTKAIETLTAKGVPLLADVYKRRSQARAALGNITGAIEDLDAALQGCVFETSEVRLDAIYELAALLHKQRNFWRARAFFTRYFEEGGAAVERKKEAWNLLGLTCTAMGDIEDGVKSYKRAIELDPSYVEAWINLLQGYKESSQVEQATGAFKVVQSLDSKAKSRSTAAYRFQAHMLQCMGQHTQAIEVLTKALSPHNGKTVTEQRVECLYLRGACNHAIGRLALAYADYQSAFGETINPDRVAIETLNNRAVSYYQGEICIYLQRHLDVDILHFCFDRDIDPEFKECWAKQTMPTARLLQRCPKLLKKGQKFPADRRDVQLPGLEALKPLVELGDAVGTLLQYRHQGFMNNRRQQRAAGIAAIELAQRMLQEIDARRNDSHTWVAGEGASGGNGKDRHAFAWRDAMDVVVRWRQLAEPNDQVLWVDMLTKEEFKNGFGSHTPMWSGQTKCVRYYMNCDRALRLFKSIILETGYVVDAHNNQIFLDDEQRGILDQATTVAEAYAAIKVDSWVVVRIKSLSRPGHTLEGTRLTITRSKDQPDAFEFSIRTPVTPDRWEDFDKELTFGFEAICSAALNDDMPLLAQKIIHFVYYWYNFMPLARGSAAVGYTTILSLFWAFDMPVTVSIPPNYQTDWEAILSHDPDALVNELRNWQLPPRAGGPPEREDSEVAKKLQCGPRASELCPDVISTLGTLRKRFFALNWGTDAEEMVSKASSRK